ncbi:MAG: DUF3467 domain-containing protein [Rikenellaceae bacterium]
MSKELNIELDETLAEGVHTNLTIISHCPTEFVLDFIRLLPGTNKGRVKSRVVLSPEQTKRLLMSLNENIQRYESTFGEIKVMPTESEMQIMGFASKSES